MTLVSESSVNPLGPGILAGRRDSIVHLRSPLIADVRFEWHRGVSKVYAVRCGTPADPIDRADLIAEHVNDEEEFKRLAGCYLRGFREGHARAAGAPALPTPGPIIRISH